VNKVVARHADGRIVKGATTDFSPEKEIFHVLPAGTGAKPVPVRLSELKAVFFVRDLEGNPAHEERKEFDPVKPPVGRKIRVEFRDGEVLVGTTVGYQPGRPGFFLVPADATANNARCYIVASAVRRVDFLP
jgi:hypothetical protein